MFSKNVGVFDKTVRVLVGIALLVAFFMMPDAPYRWLLLIGIVPLATGVLGTCPLYSLLGMNTCGMKR
ncbi:YgaP family membrane protein [Sulfitobacter sp. MF3-043]|uniref:YgaP family membrane protein n=1 Tax=Sulfitobacter sediminivivens TaxID=3252902 RepID=UPI0036DAEE93